MAWAGIVVAMSFIVVCLIALGLTADFLVDWLWFSAVGYPNVFWTILGAKVALFFAVFAVSAFFLWLNGFLAYRLAERQGYLAAVVAPWGLPHNQTLAKLLTQLFPHHPWHSFVAGDALVLAAFIAVGEVSNWDTALHFIYQEPYGQSDPLYGKDIGFYFFSLPAYVELKNWMLMTLVLSAFVAGAVYWAHGDRMEGKLRTLFSYVIAHGSALLAFYFAVKAGSYWLDRFLLLYRDNEVVVGAAYTDVHVELPVLWAPTLFSIAAALASWANLWVRSYKLPAAGVVLVFGDSFVLAILFPALFQRIYVKPNELQLETPTSSAISPLPRRPITSAKSRSSPFRRNRG
jgi:uncharacterized membrane protein (UPF0182 family)